LNAQITNGTLLIAEPFITDEHFFRKLIVIIDHNQDGTLGIVVNEVSPYFVRIENEDKSTSLELPLCLGGPVDQKDSINILHKNPEIEGSVSVGSGYFWGGDTYEILTHYKNGLLNKEQTYAISGYCGWAPGQLQKELTAQTWITSKFKPEYLSKHSDNAWKQALTDLGGTYEWLSHAPYDASLN